jgi:hypothetical protein
MANRFVERIMQELIGQEMSRPNVFFTYEQLFAALFFCF